MSSTCPHNTANFGPLAAEIDPVVWGTRENFNGFRVLAALLHGIYTVSQKRPTFTTCYNFYIHSSIATIFGTNVAEKAGNENVLYFAKSPN